MQTILVIRKLNPVILLKELTAAGIRRRSILELRGGGWELYIGDEDDRVMAEVIIGEHDHTKAPDPRLQNRDPVAEAIVEHEKKYHSEGPQ